jgi:ribose 5-phosphate isomerase
MIVGLGTGSTVEYALRKLGLLVKDGLKIKRYTNISSYPKNSKGF